HLRLAVWAKVRKLARFTNLCEPTGQHMGQLNRQRHQLRCFVTREAEHQTLITCASCIDAHRDIGRLSVECREHGTSVAVKAILRPRVANLADGVSSDSRVI